MSACGACHMPVTWCLHTARATVSWMCVTAGLVLLRRKHVVHAAVCWVVRILGRIELYTYMQFGSQLSWYSKCKKMAWRMGNRTFVAALSDSWHDMIPLATWSGYTFVIGIRVRIKRMHLFTYGTISLDFHWTLAMFNGCRIPIPYIDSTKPTEFKTVMEINIDRFNNAVTGTLD